MKKPVLPQVVTANALIEGDVIYLNSEDDWVRDLKDAHAFSDPEIANLKLLEAEARAHEAVGAYLIPVQAGPEGLESTHFREEFRSQGPSNYAHGKQTELN